MLNRIKNIVLFASGSGSNAEQIVSYFNQKNSARVVGIFSNNSNAKVLERAKRLNVPTEVFDRIELNEGNVLKKLKQ